MSLDPLTQMLLPAIEEELRNIIALLDDPRLEGYRYMLTYHLGWEGEGAGPESRGKRIRPLLVLLATSAAGGQWQTALPAASAVELIHNFSLIHDDIQDGSPLRRGRPTVWKKWGVAQAINAGDAMFTLAHLALLRLQKTHSPSVALSAMRISQTACLYLTQGQYLDLTYETLGNLTLDSYWPMVSGKTAALLAASTELGALIAGADSAIRDAYRRFGSNLGRAFQVQDDFLGIWGDSALTGKSADSDLLTGKKSLPVLFGLSQNGPFATRWQQGPIHPDEVEGLAAQLEAEGARAFTEQTAVNSTRQALQALDEAQPQGEAGEALRALTLALSKRQI